jgi:hypothetical protein
MVFTKDGQFITQGGEGTARVWDFTPPGKELRNFKVDQDRFLPSPFILMAGS